MANVRTRENPRIQCRVCASEDVVVLYVLPVLDGPFQRNGPDKRTIFKCHNCGYAFVYPIPYEIYDSYYEGLNGNYHSDHDADISRYNGVLGCLDLERIQKVLDWGCGTGTFLSLLPMSIEKWGVEASRSAAALADRRGIHTLVPSEARTPDLKNSFDAITAIDVVEHIPDPSTLKVSFSDLLRPGGRLVLLTGDLESSSAQGSGRYWYYMHYAEHVSFLSARSVRLWLEPEFEVVQVTPVSHHKDSLGSSVYLDALFSISWLLEKARFGNVLNLSAKRFVSNDHILVTARKRGK